MLLRTAVLCLAVSASSVHCQIDDADLELLISEVFGKNQSTDAKSPADLNTDPTSPKNNSGASVDCTCMAYYLCDPTGSSTPTIDVPENERCKDYTEVCCKKITSSVTQKPSTPTTPSSSIKKVGCGILNPDPIDPADGNPEGRTIFGEFPWMVAVLAIKENPQKSVYKCGGSLIHPEVVLTAAHCVADSNEKFKIRAGEWDTRNELEAFPHQDREVSSVVAHPRFYRTALHNDIALLFLKTPVEIAEHVNVVCLPPKNQVIEDTGCVVSGWGKDAFGNNPAILKKTELPIVSKGACQDALRSTRLGNLFELHKSFICAGGVVGKDTCKGDGGSPLVCPIEGLEGRYAQSGIVSWGIGGCLNTSLPGVYVNVALFRDWINKQMTNNHLDIESYQN